MKPYTFLVQLDDTFTLNDLKFLLTHLYAFYQVHDEHIVMASHRLDELIKRKKQPAFFVLNAGDVYAKDIHGKAATQLVNIKRVSPEHFSLVARLRKLIHEIKFAKIVDIIQPESKFEIEQLEKLSNVYYHLKPQTIDDFRRIINEIDIDLSLITYKLDLNC